MDIAKSYGGMTSSRDMSSNEHETNPMKMHIDKSQEVSSTVVELNRKKLLHQCVKDLCCL